MKLKQKVRVHLVLNGKPRPEFDHVKSIGDLLGTDLNPLRPTFGIRFKRNEMAVEFTILSAGLYQDLKSRGWHLQLELWNHLFSPPEVKA